MNQFTIEFKNAEDLANKIAEYNELMNPQKVVEEVKEETKKRRKKQMASIESPKEEPQTAVVKSVEKVQEAEAEPIQVEVIESEKVAEPTAVDAPPVEETIEPPVTDFDGNPVEPKPAEDVPSVEEANEPIDKKAYWAKFKAWMGEDKERGVKAFKVFAGHGLTKATSDSLTDEIMAELDELMA